MFVSMMAERAKHDMSREHRSPESFHPPRAPKIQTNDEFNVEDQTEVDQNLKQIPLSALNEDLPTKLKGRLIAEEIGLTNLQK